MENIKPIRNKLIVEVIHKEEEVLDSGIVLAAEDKTEEENPHDTLRAKVIAAGQNEEGIKKGYIVYFEQRHSAPIFNNEYKLIKASEIIGIEVKNG